MKNYNIIYSINMITILIYIYLLSPLRILAQKVLISSKKLNKTKSYLPHTSA